MCPRVPSDLFVWREEKILRCYEKRREMKWVKKVQSLTSWKSVTCKQQLHVEMVDCEWNLCGTRRDDEKQEEEESKM